MVDKTDYSARRIKYYEIRLSAGGAYIKVVH